jgi:hypothetical protein
MLTLKDEKLRTEKFLYRYRYRYQYWYWLLSSREFAEVQHQRSLEVSCEIG